MRILIIILIVLASCFRSNTANSQGHAIPDGFRYPDHPRILFFKGEEKAIHTRMAVQPVWNKMHRAIVAESDQIIGLPLLERVQIGRRLLGKSREAIRRIFYLSYVYRMTGEKKYADRAEREMINVSRFSDWNPSHFLDVAEMTMALSIGYDWLYEVLSPDARTLVRDAILTKGLSPSFDPAYNWFLTANHNWNQVCNAGMVYGALAIAERDPAMARKIIERALNTIHLPMEEYGPDGAYPEGYSYWDYGTSFNVMLISAIDKIFGNDYGMSATPGFLKTAGFLENMTGTTGMCFNWGDCGPGSSLKPAMFWFAQKTNDPSLLWVEKMHLEKEDYTSFTRDRLLPAIMLWSDGLSLDKITPPKSTVWTGQGDNPVCLLRTSWEDRNGIYLGFKAGSPSVNHGHMDIGSFIFEANDVRWASDLGSQDYESLESKGIEVFGKAQDAQRWSIFRINNFGHNVLTINNQLQQVGGYAKIDAYSENPSFRFAISDLSAVYQKQLARVKRGVAIVSSRYAVVSDELKTTDQPANIQWKMLTTAEITVTGRNTATLTKDGKKLFINVVSPANITLQTWDTKPATTYDAPNPGTAFVGFELTVPAQSESRLTVLLMPEGALDKKMPKVKSLSAWMR